MDGKPLLGMACASTEAQRCALGKRAAWRAVASALARRRELSQKEPKNRYVL
jgi:hypothetical protein